MIPLRATLLKYNSEWPQYIVLHHTAEFVRGVPKFAFDTPKSQATDFINYSFKVLKKPETMYHFLIDRQGDDYNVIVSQPLLTRCEYDDLDEQYQTSIHIGLIGDYNNDIPPNRLYRVIAYRLLAPLMRLFYLKENNIVFHSSISNEVVSCPGEFIDMTKLLNQLNEVKRLRTVKRR